MDIATTIARGRYHCTWALFDGVVIARVVQIRYTIVLCFTCSVDLSLVLIITFLVVLELI